MILAWFKNRLKNIRRERIYIVPSWKALLWTLFLFLLLGFSIVASKPEWMVFPFVLFLVMLIMMFQSNRNLAKLSLSFEKQSCLEENAANLIKLKVQNLSSKDKYSLYFRIKNQPSLARVNQVFFLPKISANQQLECNLEIYTSDPGIYASCKLDMWSYAPIGMFYSWRTITLEDTVYVVPKAIELSEPLVWDSTVDRDHEIKEKMSLNHSAAPSSEALVNEEFFEFIPLQKDSTEAFDWKVFAKNRRHVKKAFEKHLPDNLNQSRKVFMDLEVYFSRWGLDINSIRYFVGDVSRMIRGDYKLLLKIRGDFFEMRSFEDKHFWMALAKVCEALSRSEIKTQGNDGKSFS